MIDRLIISADESGEYEKQLFDKKKSVAEKDMKDEKNRLINKYDLIKDIPKVGRKILKVADFYPFVEYYIKNPFCRELHS